MSKRNLKTLWLPLVLSVAAFSACISPQEPSVAISEIVLDTALTLGVGEEYTLNATILPDNATELIAWTSSNPAIAKVENGKVTAMAKGHTTITAKSSEQTATCNVFVWEIVDDINGVEINGVVWATRNVDMPNTFAASPESAGMFYQWSINVGWSSTDPMVNSNGGTEWFVLAIGNTWEEANDPSPAGWRLPTVDDLQTLLDVQKVRYKWVTYNGARGEIFTDIATGNSIFLNAAGIRGISGGWLSEVGYEGWYWSSTYGAYHSSAPTCLVFRHTTAIGIYLNHVQRYGQSIRPVAK